MGTLLSGIAGVVVFFLQDFLGMWQRVRVLLIWAVFNPARAARSLLKVLDAVWFGIWAWREAFREHIFKPGPISISFLCHSKCS